MELLIVGEAPGRGPGGEPLSGRCGLRLAGLMGLDLGEYLERFDRVNLLDEPQDGSGKGTRFQLLPAMARASDLSAQPWTHYLLLGKRVAAAFGFRADVAYLRWYDFQGKHYATIPHPSGINQYYNDPWRTMDVAVFLRQAVDDDRCIEWTGAHHEKGYGRLRLGDGSVGYAHREAWEWKYGPVPVGFQVLHDCDNPPCWRWDHLFLGTPADNSADMVAKGRYRRTLTPEAVEYIRTNYTGANRAALAKKFGVYPQTIWDAATRRTHVPKRSRQLAERAS